MAERGSGGTATSDDPSPGSVRLWIIRHGERADEAPTEEGRQWVRKHQSQWFDPPLTERGQEQARLLAEELAMQLGPSPGFSVIHCSPLRRALQTAEPVSKRLGLPIQVVPSLGACTAAVQEHGMLSFGKEQRLLFAPSQETLREAARVGGSYFEGKQKGRGERHLSDLPFLNAAERAELCPLATWLEEDSEALVHFLDSCDCLCDTAAGAVGASSSDCRTAHVLLVSHRELMYDFFARPDVDRTSFKMHTPDYCSVLKLLRQDPIGSSRGTLRWLVEEMPRPKQRRS